LRTSRVAAAARPSADLHHLRYAADAVQVDREIVPDGFRSQSTGTLARALEIVDRPVDAGGAIAR
jgi:hypothetical protein